MGAYLSSGDMPCVLMVRDMDVTELRAAVPKWMRESKRLILGNVDGAGAGPTVLLNFGAVRVFSVTADNPTDDAPIWEIGGHDPA